ncbi:MAG TPA: methyltransferase domain-containing protein [Rhodanobacteraceae bacterium]|nr:methyltransferase domain-containing protein [Rhodanobacteraceae bacterium]
MSFKDHFSGHAALYASARPHYPAALFDWLASAAPARGCVWDAGCGNGQASVALAQRFDRVIATDPSATQLDNAVAHPRIEYRNEPIGPSTPGSDRYATSLAAHSVDAVTVAQALHWFDLAPFLAEVRRVAKPGALFAAWCYANCGVTPEVDRVIAHLYDPILGRYWSPERRLVDEGYASLDIPFAQVAAPAFEMRVDWNACQLLAYLTSWSAAQKYTRATGHDAVAAIADELIAAWGDAEKVKPVRWTLAIRAGRVR